MDLSQFGRIDQVINVAPEDRSCRPVDGEARRPSLELGFEKHL
jgi:hypothetical protein